MQDRPVIQHVTKLREIADCYDVFIIDLWGVLHDGLHPFTQSTEVLQHLMKAHKIVYLVTNNSKTNQENITQLEQMGLSRDLYTDLISAGQKCLEMFLNRTILADHQRPLKAFKRP